MKVLATRLKLPKMRKWTTLNFMRVLPLIPEKFLHQFSDVKS